MEDKTCSRCGQRKPLGEFYRRDKPNGGVWWQGQCRDCIRAARKRWYVANRAQVISKQHEFYAANRDQEIARMRVRATRYRDAALDAYGGRCACCDETRRMFLTIDHVNGDGAAHRRQLGASASSRLVRWLCEQGYPPGFQVLCWNCNHAKYLNGGTCPHQQDDPGHFVPPEPLPVACPDCGYRSSAYGVAVHRGKKHQ